MTVDDIRSIPGGWGEAITRRLKEKDRLELEAFLASAWNAEVYPCRDHVFAAFEATHLDSVRTVILGQDPYPNAGQACGLAFSVPKGTVRPPSLRKILKTARDDMGIHVARDATLAASRALPAQQNVHAGLAAVHGRAPRRRSADREARRAQARVRDGQKAAGRGAYAAVHSLRYASSSAAQRASSQPSSGWAIARTRSSTAVPPPGS